MPVITIDMWEGRNKETKRKLIQSVAKAVADALGIPIDRIQIVIHDVPKDNWGVKGEQAAQIK